MKKNFNQAQQVHSNNVLKIINLNKNSFFINLLMANSNLKKISEQLKV